MRNNAFPSCALLAVALGALLATTTQLKAGPHALVARDIVVTDTPVPIDYWTAPTTATATSSSANTGAHAYGTADFYGDGSAGSAANSGRTR
jgi:hypothetical protein